VRPQGVGQAFELLSEIAAWHRFGVDWEESGSNQDDQMQLTGQLHGIVTNYRVEVDDEGRMRREDV
jgi:xanthine dehydrogenase molybdopterin-binding subunit B